MNHGAGVIRADKDRPNTSFSDEGFGKKEGEIDGVETCICIK